MAYVKKFDRALNTIKQCIEKDGIDTEIEIVGCKEQCKLWNKFPICVQDICVDNLVLIKHADDWAIFGGDFDDNKAMTVSKEMFDRHWRDLKKIKTPHAEYVARVLNNLENVLDKKNIEKVKKTKNVKEV